MVAANAEAWAVAWAVMMAVAKEAAAKAGEMAAATVVAKAAVAIEAVGEGQSQEDRVVVTEVAMVEEAREVARAVVTVAAGMRISRVRRWQGR